MAEDDFRRWEREFDMGVPDERATGGRGLVLAAGATATGCAAMIALGEVVLGVAGLVLSSVILLLWRIGM
ncbi:MULTISPECIES: hypothetical protein [Actinomadura]|uniref:Uncharacterized protein n=1 Tax=Actinomadura madurae TaxID=1993 RepID=A0A1I5WYX1_9ACTN|nr:hypothetical protein [Actinomadura madurae]SFQ24874.1 hypothetical protein SAMN04489713_12534 [Actinomadura madurae]SPT60717.1 Uncharacterised protein [Actinomadura madurae]